MKQTKKTYSIMKKTFKTLVFAIVGLLALASCEDVPAPYSVPDKNSNTISPADEIFSQSFTSSLGDFASLSESGSLTWSSSSKYGAIISGYDDWDGTGQKSNKPGVTYLISPEIDLSGTDNAYIIVEQAINYAKSTLTDDHHILIRLAGTEVWTELPMVFNGLGSSFDYKTQNIQLPQSFVGQKVQVALKHIAHDSYSSTWEVKSIKVAKGLVPTTDDGGNDGGDESAITCAKAVELTNALADGATSNETYTVIGYITQVVGNVSNNQQTFWMADEKDGGKVFEAYWANLPEGVTEFTVGTKVKITGKLMKYVKDGKVTPEMKNATVVILNDDGGGSTEEEGISVTCAEAVRLTNALADGATSTETYTITGYITEVIGNVSRNQQTFWMADEKDGGRVFEAYWANLPEGVTEFKAGSKVKITGKLMKFINKTTSEVVPEIKNADVVILEDGGSGQGGDTPVEGTEVTCAQAVELVQALADGGTSTEIYTVTGYITEVFGNVSRNQQSFWMADTKDGGQVFEAYWANLPEGVSAFTVGSKVKITGNLLKYVKNGVVTPEIKNANVVILEAGDGGGTPEPPTPGPGGDTVTDLVNGDFESWVSDTEPTGWRSASTASNAEVSKSVDARNGSFACKVGAPGTQNKRLATQEITLEAGSYTFSYYAKSTTTNVCQSRAGYVPVTNGSVGAYKYGGYVDINNSEWTLVSYDFELTSTTTLCLFASNPKETAGKTISQDILIDDATLVKK